MKTLLLIGMIFTGTSLFAQDWSTDVYKYGEEYPGYIIDADGNKTEGFITYQDRYTMQNKIIFWKEKGNKKSKEKLDTKDLKEYKVADKLYHVIHYSGGLLSKPLRGNLVVKEGCITEYMWYNRDDNYLTMQKQAGESDDDYLNRKYPPTAVFLKKGDEEPKTLDNFALKFSKKMSDWIADNHDLAGKVASKEKGYGMLKFYDIIEEYNAACEEK